MGVNKANWSFFHREDLQGMHISVRYYLGYNCPVAEAGMIFVTFAEIVCEIRDWFVGLVRDPYAVDSLDLQDFQASGGVSAQITILPCCC